MSEIWLPVKGYEGLYEVSNLGNVRSLNFGRTGQIKLKKPREIRRYLSVNLWKDGEIKTCRVHRLVAEAFIPNQNNLPQVNHKDENKKNNCVENLEWCDSSYNINYGERNVKVGKKLKNGPCSKPVLQYTKTGELVREWESTREAGRNGFDQSAVQKCCRGNTKLKSYKGYIWKYK